MDRGQNDRFIGYLNNDNMNNEDCGFYVSICLIPKTKEDRME